MFKPLPSDWEDHLLPDGIESAGVLVLAVGLVAGAAALGRVKPLVGGAGGGSEETGTPAGRPVVFQLYTAAALDG